MSFSRASSGVTNSSIIDPRGFDGLASNDDDQLFFVTSYSDFEKLGKSHRPSVFLFLSGFVQYTPLPSMFFSSLSSKIVVPFSPFCFRILSPNSLTIML